MKAKTMAGLGVLVLGAFVSFLLAGCAESYHKPETAEEMLKRLESDRLRTAKVVVASRNVCEGEAIDSGNVVEKQMRAGDIPESAVTSIEMSKGTHAAVQVSKGAVILSGHLAHRALQDDGQPWAVKPWDPKVAADEARQEAEEKALDNEIEAAEKNEDPEKEAVVIAYKDIAAGDEISYDSLTLRALKRDKVPPGAIHDLLLARDFRHSIKEIKKDQVVTANCLKNGAAIKEIEAAEKNEDPTKEVVVVAYEDICAGDLITAENLTEKAIQRDKVPPDAIRSLMMAAGAYSARKIKKNEVLTAGCQKHN